MRGATPALSGEVTAGKTAPLLGLINNKMIVEITDHIKTKRKIEVEFPYYYKHEFGGDHSDHITYGKIEQDYSCTSIGKVECFDGRIQWEMEKGKTDKSYFKEELKCSEQEYEAAKKEAMNFIQSVL